MPPPPGTTPLPYLLDADSLLPLLRAHPDVVAALLPHLPPGQQDADNLAAILRSPQLRQAGMALSAALDSNAANLATVCASFGLRAEDGHAALVAGDSVAALVACVQAQAQREREAAAAAAAPTQSPPPPPPPPSQ